MFPHNGLPWVANVKERELVPSSTQAEPSIVWLRRDLRLADQAALLAAAEAGPVIPVYVLETLTPHP